MGYLRTLLTSAANALTGVLELRGAIGSGTLAGAYTVDPADAYVAALDPGGAARNVTLPPAFDGRVYVLTNTADAAGEVLTALQGSTEVGVVHPGQAAVFACEGAVWRLLGHLGLPTLPRHAQQTLDMADAQVALVYGTPIAGQAKLVADVLLVDANSATTEDLLLPPEATSFGRILFVANTGGEDITVKEDSDTTLIATVSTTECAFFVCDGVTWRGGVVKTT